MAERIVLYIDNKKASPFSDRVEIALLEAGAEYSTCMIDLGNKPAFYTEKINRRGKVPAITYGGPDVPPDQPSADSVKLDESLVILEFIADLFPASGLLPADPVARARVRYFMDAASTKLQVPFIDFLRKGGSADAVLAALEEVQSLLPVGGQFAVGNKFTIADATLAPLLWCFEVCVKNDIGKYGASEGKKALDAYEGERLGALRKYFEGIKTRNSYRQSVQSEEELVAYYNSQFK